MRCAKKQKQCRWLIVGTVLMAMMTAFAAPSWSSEATAASSQKVEMLEHRLDEIQSEIVRQLNSPELNGILSELQAMKRQSDGSGNDRRIEELQRAAEQLQAELQQQKHSQALSLLEQEKAALEKELFKMQPKQSVSSASTLEVLGSTGQISGKVTNSSGGGITGAYVYAYPVGSYAYSGYDVTDDQGNYTVTGLAAGDYQIT